MARRCGWCTAPNRIAWERRVLSGESIRSVSESTPFTVSAAYRHLTNHLSALLLADLASARNLQSRTTAADFVARLLGIADDAQAIRNRALLAGDGRLALKAGESEAATLNLLLARLGISDQETAANLNESRQLAKALGAVLHQGRPELARELAAELDGTDLGTALLGLAKDLDQQQPGTSVSRHQIGATA